MSKEKSFKEFLKWASQNEKNKKAAIHRLSSAINFLKESNSTVTDEDLKKISGGYDRDPNCVQGWF